MKTYAPSFTNSLAVTRPIPWSPSVISAIRPSSFPIIFPSARPSLPFTGASGWPPRLRSTAEPPENHAERIELCLNTRYRTKSFAFFRVRVEVNKKMGLQMDLNAHLLSSGHFFAPHFYREDAPEALNAKLRKRGLQPPVRSKDTDHAIW